MIRAFPPVHAAISPGSMLRAVEAHLAPDRAETVHREAHEAIGRAYPSRHAILTDSGTSALVLALQTTRPAGVLPVVALPGFCCPDVGAAAIRAGYRVVLYDIDPLSLLPAADSLRSAIKHGATHVLIAHLYGIVHDLEALMATVDTPDVTFIEDAAQAAGGTCRGVPAGCQGAIGILSFGRGKGINAGGGGALLTSPKTVSGIQPLGSVSRGDSLRSLVVAGATALMSSPLLYGLPRALPWVKIGDTQFYPAGAPRVTSLTSAALLPAAIAENQRALPARRLLAAFYDAAVRGTRLQAIAGQARPDGGALRFAVRVSRAGDLSALAAQGRRGVVRSYPRDLSQYPEIREALVVMRDLPGSEELARTTLTFPSYLGIAERDVQGVLEAFKT